MCACRSTTSVGYVKCSFRQRYGSVDRRHGSRNPPPRSNFMIDADAKIQAEHRKRNAYLYVRQSTPRQVLEHQESTQRQYGLRQQALRLGWAEEQIIVIDTDLGQSGASAADRVGFQRLVTEVSLERAVLVLGLEVSRLARNCSDWHRLLEI